ncbi:hypothetical protein P4234_16615 [Pseudomonas aeruginosa]|nr:hypothetical protein [Pseudomonas aeruginosa]
MALGITGVHQIKEYKRFYPSSELTAQLIGLVTSTAAARKAPNWASTTG